MNHYRRKMRHASILCFAAAAVIVLMGISTGCTGKQSAGPVDGSRTLKTANAIYLDIRTVITDPEVMTLFAPKELERLAELERQYLEVADTLRAFPDDAQAIEKLSWIATEILVTLNQIQAEKYRPYIAAIRISISLLKNHL